MALRITTAHDTPLRPDAQLRPSRLASEPIRLWQGTVDGVSATVVALPGSSTDSRARSDVYSLYLADDADPAATLEVDVDTFRVMGRVGLGTNLPSGHTAADALTQIVGAHRRLCTD